MSPKRLGGTGAQGYAPLPFPSRTLGLRPGLRDRSSCSRCFIQNTIEKHKERKDTQITPTPPFRPKNYISQLTFRSGLLLMLTIVGEVSLVEMNIFYGFLWPLPASKD